MKTNIFSLQPDFSILQRGDFNGLTFILGKDDVHHPDLSLIIVYKQDQDSQALFMVTLSKKTIAAPVQTISFYGLEVVDAQLLFSEPSSETFLKTSHQWVQKHHTKAPPTWAPPLKHHPTIIKSLRNDFGTLLDYRYQYHERARTEDVALSHALICYAPQETHPSLFLYVEHSTKDTNFIHMFFRNKHTMSIAELDTNSSRTQLITLATNFLSSLDEQEIPEETGFSIPILKLTSEEIQLVLRQEQMYEHSLLIILISTIGFVLYSLISIPYIGWFFLILSFFCWLISAAHGVYSYAALTSNYSIRIPASTLLMIPFFFPQYGPAIFLFLMMSNLILLRNAIRSKGIRLTGNGIQEDDKLLLVARKMSIEQDAKLDQDTQ